MVGNLVLAIFRHVGDDDAGARCRIDVHAVHADAKAGDNLAAFELLDNLCGDFGVRDEQSVRLAGYRQDILRCSPLGQLEFRVQLGQHLRGRIEIRERRIGNSDQ